MIVLIALAAVVVAVVGAGLLGIGVLSGENRHGRPAENRVALAVPVAAVLGVVLLAVLALGVLGARSGSREGQPAAVPSPAVPTTTTWPRGPGRP